MSGRCVDILSTNINRYKLINKCTTIQNWLIKVNAKNRWHNTKSPVIWKELVRSGGKAYLIGGLSEFWEYCYDYYGLQSFLSKSDLQKLVADNLMVDILYQIPIVV